IALLLRGGLRSLALGLFRGLTRLLGSLARLFVAIGLHLLQDVDTLLGVQRQRRIRKARNEFLQRRDIGRILDLVPFGGLPRGSLAVRRLLLRQSRHRNIGDRRRRRLRRRRGRP